MNDVVAVEKIGINETLEVLEGLKEAGVVAVEKIGINETLEVLEGLKEAGVLVAKITADKKIGLTDLQYVVEAAKKFDVFKNSITGADKVIAEAKDLDSMEAAIIVAKVFEIIKAIKEANACPTGDCQPA